MLGSAFVSTVKNNLNKKVLVLLLLVMSILFHRFVSKFSQHLQALILKFVQLWT